MRPQLPTKREHGLRVLTGLVAVLAGLVGAAYAGPAHAREDSAATDPPWTPYPGPTPATGVNRLHDVEAVSDSSAWAVGRSGGHHLLLKWDGIAWLEVSVSPPEAGTSALIRVHPVSTTSAWAVGFAHGQPWILRYRNGGWSSFSTAGLPSGGLAAIATTSKGVPVVVTRGGYSSRAKVAKWNGSTWLLTALPIPKSDYSFSAASEIRALPGTGDAFVVVGTASGSNGAWVVRGRPGRTWQDFSPPPTAPGAQGPFGGTYDQANDAYANSGSDITVVGTVVTYSDALGPPPGFRPYLTRWNGSKWFRQKLSSVSGDSIDSIAVQPGKSRLLVGFNDETMRADAFEYTPAIGWKRLPSSPAGSHLYAAGAIPGTSRYWAVGSQGSVSTSETGWPMYSEDSTYLLKH